MNTLSFKTECAVGLHVSIHGSIDNRTAPGLAEELARLASAAWGSVDGAEGEETLLLDLSNVEFINSTGIGALLRCHRAAVENERRLMVLIHPDLADIFEIAKMHSLFQVVIPHQPTRVLESDDAGP